MRSDEILLLGAALARRAVSAPDPVPATAMTFSPSPIQPPSHAIIMISMNIPKDSLEDGKSYLDEAEAIISISMLTLVPCPKVRRRFAMTFGVFVP